MDKEFWKKKKLADFSEREWEAVCMRCGKCCLHKQAENGRIFFTNQMCGGFDFKTGKCSRYKTRLSASCVKVDLHLLQTERELLPETCAYRLLFEGKELPDYHPLVSGDRNSAHKACRTVLEIPLVYSEKEMLAAVKRVITLPEDKAERLMKRYELRYLEYYEIPPKSSDNG